MSPTSFPRRRIAFAVICLAVSTGIVALCSPWPAPSAPPAEAPDGDGRGPGVLSEPPKLLLELAAGVEQLTTAGRALLLGRRDPAQGSCVRPGQAAGPLVLELADPNGGPGTRMAHLFKNTVPRSAWEAYAWFQNDLRRIVTGMRRRNAPLAARSRRLAQYAKEMSRLLRSSRSWPDGLAPVRVARSSHWPGRCVLRLNEAVAARDLSAARRWADELAAATFALADLHRWLELLLSNHVASLDFQAKCGDVFARADPPRGRSGAFADHYFPASYMELTRVYSYLEVERQAETLHHPPPVPARPADASAPDVPAAVWMPPHLRSSFLLIRSRLSPKTQKLWDRAASAEYERSYLANMLFRASTAKVLDEMSVVLRRFERSNADPTLAELMDVLFYRGGVWASGTVWADRYDRRLMQTASRFVGPRHGALRGAHGAMRRFFGGWHNYRGGVKTLGRSLDLHKMDCLRGVDMIAALYRNAGGSGIHLIRLSCGVYGHSLGAADVGASPRCAPAIVDPFADGGGQPWPEAFFHGYRWPAGMPGEPAAVFSAELTVRGLDGYLFAEGYVIRGANAGTLMRAALPYLPGHQTADVGKVYDGPYPEAPKLVLQAASQSAGPAGP